MLPLQRRLRVLRVMTLVYFLAQIDISMTTIIMFDHHRYRDIIATLASVMPIFDLARFARVNKMAAQCVRREMVVRIGPRNYELVAEVDPLTAAPIVEVEARSMVRYNDLKYFYLEVDDPAAHWPLVIALRSRYKDLDVRIGTKDECEPASIDTIFTHWIHVGLAGCARLLFIRDIEDTSYGISEECVASKIPARRMNKIAAMSQEQLLSVAIQKNDHQRIREIVDMLDHHHFNLLVEIEYHNSNHFDIHRAILKSNVVWPRYDPFFADRMVARFACWSVNRIFASLPNGFEPEMTSANEVPFDKIGQCPHCPPMPIHKHLPYHSRKPMFTRCVCTCHDCTCGGCIPDMVTCSGPSLCGDCKCCFCDTHCYCPCKCDTVCQYSCTCCMCIYGCVCYE